MNIVKEQVDFFPLNIVNKLPDDCSNSLIRFFHASTLVEWSSQNIPQTSKPVSCNIFKQSNNSFFIQSPTIFLSGRVITTYGTLLFNPTIIKHITPLYSYPFLPLPQVSPPQYTHYQKSLHHNTLITKSLSTTIHSLPKVSPPQYTHHQKSLHHNTPIQCTPPHTFVNISY